MELDPSVLYNPKESSSIKSMLVQEMWFTDATMTILQYSEV